MKKKHTNCNLNIILLKSLSFRFLNSKLAESVFLVAEDYLRLQILTEPIHMFIYIQIDKYKFRQNFKFIENKRSKFKKTTTTLLCYLD